MIYFLSPCALLQLTFASSQAPHQRKDHIPLRVKIFTVNVLERLWRIPQDYLNIYPSFSNQPGISGVVYRCLILSEHRLALLYFPHIYVRDVAYLDFLTSGSFDICIYFWHLNFNYLIPSFLPSYLLSSPFPLPFFFSNCLQILHFPLQYQINNKPRYSMK